VTVTTPGGGLPEVPYYRVRLAIHADQPVTAEQLMGLRGGRGDVTATRRGDDLHVTLTMEGGDSAGAHARALNVVLDQVPGQVQHAEITLTEPPHERATARPRRPARRRVR
jgi:hypothetical protein